MSSRDIGPVYRGYRLQALYAIHRILSESRDEEIFQPEGSEDLDIVSVGGDLIEAVQVKSRARLLAVSDLGPEKPEGFFARVAARLAEGSDAAVRIVVFGGVGPELDAAVSGAGSDRNAVADKIAQHGHVSREQAVAVLDRCQIELLVESHVVDRVVEAIRATQLGIDPETSLDLLTYWMFRCAEDRASVDAASIPAKLGAIGGFLSDRAAHHEEWSSSISPVSGESDRSVEELRAEFGAGVSSRYEHIAAGVDVPRPIQLERVREGFSRRRAVIIHGASGQGKTALAFRYMRDSVPQSWCYAIRVVEDRGHALRIARALRGHAESLRVPLFLFVDVSPSDRGWPRLVEDLLALPHVRVLVTIREEDLARADTGGLGPASVSLVDLELDRTEAEEIYEGLTALRGHPASLDFAACWRTFGEAGPLLEFVHVVTQGESLESRLRSQVRRLSDEVRNGGLLPRELDLLRIVAVASEFGGSLDVLALASEVQLPSPQRTLELFEREYLLSVRPDESRVAGLHPVRSAVLVRLLTGDALSPWIATAARCLECMISSDVEAFLLFAFSRRPVEVPRLVETLCQRSPRSWEEAEGIASALTWLGVRRYVDTNEEAIEQAIGFLGHSWSLALPFDIANANQDAEQSLWALLDEHASPEVRARSEELRGRMSPKSEVLEPVRQWMQAVALPSLEGASVAEWLGFAGAIWWGVRVGKADLGSMYPSDSLLEVAGSALPLPVLATVVPTLWLLDPDRTASWLEERFAALEERLREEAGALRLQDDGELLRVDFIMELEPEEGGVDGGDGYHTHAIRMIDLISGIFPHRSSYGCAGFGHRILGEVGHDSTVKTDIPRKALPDRRLVELNSVFAGLGAMRFRPDDWEAFALELMSFRRGILALLEPLAATLEASLSRSPDADALRALEDAWDDARRLVDLPPRLPRTAVDEWGFAREGTSERGGVQETSQLRLSARRNLKLQRLSSLMDPLDKISSSLRNFTDQVGSFLLLRGRNEQTEEVVETRRLSLLNLAEVVTAFRMLQSEARRFVARREEPAALRALEQRETSTLFRLALLWPGFALRRSEMVSTTLGALERRWAENKRRISRSIAGKISRVPDVTRCSVDWEGPSWEGESTLWLRIGVRDTARLGDAVRAAATAAGRVLQRFRNAHGAEMLIDTAVENVGLIPIFSGRLLSPSVHVVSTSIAEHMEQFADTAPVSLIPRPAGETLIRSLGLACVQGVEADLARRLVEEATEGYLKALHVLDFRRFDGAAELPLAAAEHIRSELRRAAEALRSAMNAASDLLSATNNRSGQVRELAAEAADAAERVLEVSSRWAAGDEFTEEDVELFSLSWAAIGRKATQLIAELARIQ